MRVLPRLWLLALPVVLASGTAAQSIEFESNGLRYQAMTKSGLTVMFAPLPSQIREYSVLQVAVSNGSPSARSIKPEDFSFVRPDGSVLPAIAARTVVVEFLTRAGRNDVVRLVTTYEMGLYGIPRFNSTNGYEQRRQAAHAEVENARLKAAAAASAIAFVQTRLQPGESTDGAVFFSTAGKPLGPGKLIVTAGVERYEFEMNVDKHPGELQRRP